MMKTLQTALRRLGLLSLVSTLAACQSPKVAAINYNLPPHLPSPTTSTYARHIGPSVDPLLNAISGTKAFEASLSGAAAGLALNAINKQGGLSGWEVREALWQAGYPYPVDSVNGWTGKSGQPPPPGVSSWLEASTEEQDSGLVRAVGPSGVAWVGLRSTPKLNLGPQPREANTGKIIHLPAIQNTSYQVSDPFGNLLSGPMDNGVSITLIQPGEWLFEVRVGDQVAALFPIYVGIDIPDEPLLTKISSGTIDSSSASITTKQILVDIRAAYGLAPWTSNLLLDKAAQAALTTGSNSEQKAAALGYSNSKRMSCTAATIEDCIDSIVWSPQLRSILLSSSVSELGVSALITTQSIQLELLVSAQTL